VFVSIFKIYLLRISKFDYTFDFLINGLTMRNILIMGFLLFMLFRVYQERGTVLKNNLPEQETKVEKVAESITEQAKTPEPIVQDTDEKPSTEAEKPSAEAENSSESEKKEEKSKERVYAHKPEGFVERVITNVVTDFVKTPAGKEMAKSMLTPRDMDLKNQSVAFSTSGFSSIKRKYDVKPVLNSTDRKTICGQKIKLQYQIKTPNSKEAETKTEEYVVGKHAIEIFNDIADGMAINEVVSANYSASDYNNDQTITMTVIEHLSKLNFEYSKVRIFDDYISTSDGVTCGDKVKLQYHIFAINGESIKQGELEMTLGDYNYPEVLSYAIDAMPLLGTRTVLLPQSYLALSKSNPLIKNANNNYVIMELSKVFVYPKEIK